MQFSGKNILRACYLRLDTRQEEGPSIEKMVPFDWSVGKAVEYIFFFCFVLGCFVLDDD